MTEKQLDERENRFLAIGGIVLVLLILSPLALSILLAAI